MGSRPAKIVEFGSEYRQVLIPVFVESRVDPLAARP